MADPSLVHTPFSHSILTLVCVGGGYVLIFDSRSDPHSILIIPILKTKSNENRAAAGAHGGAQRGAVRTLDCSYACGSRGFLCPPLFLCVGVCWSIGLSRNPPSLLFCLFLCLCPCLCPCLSACVSVCLPLPVFLSPRSLSLPLIAFLTSTHIYPILPWQHLKASTCTPLLLFPPARLPVPLHPLALPLLSLIPCACSHTHTYLWQPSCCRQPSVPLHAEPVSAALPSAIGNSRSVFYLPTRLAPPPSFRLAPAPCPLASFLTFCFCCVVFVLEIDFFFTKFPREIFACTHICTHAASGSNCWRLVPLRSLTCPV